MINETSWDSQFPEPDEPVSTKKSYNLVNLPILTYTIVIINILILCYCMLNSNNNKSVFISKSKAMYISDSMHEYKLVKLFK